MEATRYDDAYVAQLFDRMGPTYDLVNRISSFGFCEWWRYQCVRQARIPPGAVVCDMMAGSGECWPYLRWRKVARIISVDFSPVMVRRQQHRRRGQRGIEVLLANATRTGLPADSVDGVVGAFGLKTLTPETLAAFAGEIQRILKPGGRFSLLEISSASGWWLGKLYRWYVSGVIPRLGKMLLGDMECYRMLGVYTEAFGSCERIATYFTDAGLEVEVRRHVFGCATALVGVKPRRGLASGCSRMTLEL